MKIKTFKVLGVMLIILAVTSCEKDDWCMKCTTTTVYYENNIEREYETFCGSKKQALDFEDRLNEGAKELNSSGKGNRTVRCVRTK